VPARRDSLPLSFPRWKTYDPWRKEENLPGKPHFKGQSGKKWRVADPYWQPEDREVDVTTFVCVFVCSCMRLHAGAQQHVRVGKPVLCTPSTPCTVCACTMRIQVPSFSAFAD
jgi:hypothetical protein